MFEPAVNLQTLGLTRSSNVLFVSTAGSDTTGDGSYYLPFATITRAALLAGGSGFQIALMPGGTHAAATITSAQPNLSIVGLNNEPGGLIAVAGLTFQHGSSSCRVQGISTPTLTHSGAGSLWLSNMKAQAFTKSGSGYVETINSDLQQGPVQITGSGMVVFGSQTKVGALVVNNSGAAAVLQNVQNSLPITVTAGSLAINNSPVYAATGTGNAITSSVGTTVQVSGAQFLTPTNTAARVALAGAYAFDDVQFDRANSTLGTNLGTLAHFDRITTLAQTAAAFEAVADIGIRATGEIVRAAPLSVTALLTAAPTGTTAAGVYIQTAGAPPAGVALNDLFHWSGTAATVLRTYAAAPVAVAVGSPAATYTKNAGGWRESGTGGGGGDSAPTATRIAGAGTYRSWGVIDSSGRFLFAKGADSFGGDGDGSSTGAYRPLFPLVFILPNGSPETGAIVQAEVLSGVAYALFDTGNLYTMGRNAQANLVDGSTVDTGRMQLVQTGVVRVWAPRSRSYDVSYNSFFILKTDGRLYSGGSGGSGSLGLGDVLNRTTFQLVSYFPANSVREVWIVSTQATQTWVQRTDGTIHACGRNASGSLGVGTTADVRTTFTDVTAAWGGLTAGDVVNISGGTSYYDGSAFYVDSIIMHRRSAGGVDTVRSCGNNDWGQLGTGNTTSRTTPILVSPAGFPTRFTQVTSFGGVVATVLALSSSGDLWGWGRNENGQLADGTTSPVLTPKIIRTGVDRVFNGDTALTFLPYRIGTFVRGVDGYVYASGPNNGGSLGVGDITQRTSWQRVMLPAGVLIEELTVNNQGSEPYVIARDSTNTLWVWGRNALNVLSDVNTQVNIDIRIPRPLRINC